MVIAHLLDDDITVTQACVFLLESLRYEMSCWEQGEKFLVEANLHQVGVLPLDMHMPVLDGHAVHEIMRQRASTLAVVSLTGYGDVPMAVEQMKRGAVDFLQKPVLAVPLQAVLKHALQVSAAAFSRQEIICCYQQLTPKERELVHLVAKGSVNWEIADAMNIAVCAVKVHRARVMEKMQAGGLVEFVNRPQRI